MTPMTEALTDMPTRTPPAAAFNPLDEPTYEEVQAEWVRFFDTPENLLDPGGENFEKYVAFHGGKPVDYDEDPTALLHRAASALGVHPARVVISYLGPF